MPPGGAGDTTADYDALTNPPPRPSFDDDDFANYDGDIYGSGAAAGGDEFDRPGQPTRPGGASDLVNRYLFPTERFRGEWRRHWIHIVKRLGLAVLVTFVLGWVAGLLGKHDVPYGMAIAVVVWFLLIGYLLWDVLEWYLCRFVLTNKRVMLIEGVFNRTVAMMPLARVTDMKYTQTALGRVLGYGTFEIESAGQDQALRNVQNLPNPTDLYLQVVEEMYEPEASEARRAAQADGT
ncbi:PH domain-containing protein [Luedemannella helvata]|uniref:YdbS-like PH domain-containing protein n=1 Tax=Luedemannella helvata TaxID=349315 RepID=A0ABP4XCX2_9ACTN